MDYLLRAEQQYRDHYERIANADREAWKRPQRTVRAHRLPRLRVMLAKALHALAARLAPAPSATTAPNA